MHVSVRTSDELLPVKSSGSANAQYLDLRGEPDRICSSYGFQQHSSAPTMYRSILMPIASHTKAAEHHEIAAKAHKAAAELHGKGDHAAAIAKSTAAHSSGEHAQKQSAEANGKSASHAKK